MAKEKKEAPRLISKSVLKEMFSEAGLRTSGELIEGIDQWFADGVIKQAAARCKANGRATVRLEDL